MHYKTNHFIALAAAVLMASSAGAKTVSALRPGTLADAGIDPAETSLTITGTMNAADFSYILDNLNALHTLDISGATIAAYSGNALPYTGLSTSAAATLPDYGLTGLKALTRIILPANLKAIGRGSLSGTGITSLNIPDGVKSIGAYAAMRCDRLESLTLPASATEIGTRAFAYCPKLSAVSIGSGVSSIPEGLFEACGGLKSIDLAAMANCTEIGPWAFAQCAGATKLVLPENTEAIGRGALYGTGGVDALVVPAGVSYIDDNAMSAMSTLSVLNVAAVDNVPELGQNVWSRLEPANVMLVVPDNSIADYRGADQWKDFNIISHSEWQASTDNIETGIGNSELKVVVDGGMMTVTAGDTPLGRVSVFDTAGRRIATAEAADKVQFDTAAWTRGVYLVVAGGGARKVSI